MFGGIGWKIMVMAKKGVAAVVNGLFIWGSNTGGSLGVNDSITKSSPVQVGTATDWSMISMSDTFNSNHTLALKSGQLWGWGGQQYGQIGRTIATFPLGVSSPIQVGSDSDWSEISAGNQFSLGLKSNGTLWAWGRNLYYKLGDETLINRSSPVQIGTDTNWASVSAGNNSSFAIKTTGTLWGWGRNNYHQLGLLNLLSASSPVQIGTATDWATIRGGITTGGAIKTGGSLWTWGGGSDGQLGLGDTLNRVRPNQVGSLTNWSKLAIGRGYGRPTCGAIKTDGTLWTWGNNQYYNLGLGNRTWRSSPTQVGSATDWNEIAIGQDHGVAIKATNQLWTFGVGNFGSQGQGNVFNGTVPARVGLLTDWAKTAAGRYCSGAVKTDGTMWTWGQNQSGKLGLGDTTNRSSPVQVGTDTNWSMLSMGINIAAAVKTTGTLWTWGNNGSGELGTSNTVSRSSPAQVGTDTNWSVVRVGHGHMAGLKTDGTLWMWGSGASGRLGQGNTTSRSSPVQVGTNTDWAEVYCGVEFTVARKTDGTVWAWGSNGTSRLGNSENIFISPTQVGTASNWSKVRAMQHSTIARTTTGQLWSWGRNTQGELGLGNTVLRSSPIQIGTATDWSDITCGTYSVISKKNDNTLWAWGANSNAQLLSSAIGSAYSSPVQINSSTDWSSVSLGSSHAIALKSNGTLWAWGTNSNRQLGQGVDLFAKTSYSTPTQVGNGTKWWTSASPRINANMAIFVDTDGKLFSIGINNVGQLGINNSGTSNIKLNQIGTDTNWLRVDGAGTNGHVLALKTNGTLWGWGVNSTGQLGINNILNRSSPVQIGTDTNWSQISTSSTGSLNSFAIKTTGTLWAWGNNLNGTLGLGDAVARSSPVQIGTDTNWAKISGGANHTLAVKTNGTLWGWGVNSNGQVGDGTLGNRSSPVQIGTNTNWRDVYAGNTVSLAITTTGTLWAWGNNGAAQLGTPLENGIIGFIPTQVGTATNWSSVSSGARHNHAITTTGTLWGWGIGGTGRLGTESTTTRFSPFQVGTDTNWSRSFGAYSHSGAIRTTGTLWMFGNNSQGRLGLNDITNRSSPVQLGTATDWSTAALGYSVGFAIKTTGTLWAWGFGGSGELGLGNTTSTSSPVQVGTDTNWSKVTVTNAGSTNNSVLALKTNGTLWAWGFNNNGTLGLGDAISRSSPVQVGTDTNWSDVICSGNSAFAMKTNGTLWAWGYGTRGVLGLGDALNRSSPVQVGTDTNWAKISGTHGIRGVCGIKTDGTIWSWGYNVNTGVLGTDTIPETSSPIQIGSGTNWSSVSSGRYFMHAIKTDGTLWSWGQRTNGGTGIATVTNIISPVQVGTDSDWSKLSLSNQAHVLAIKTTGTLWGWGSNFQNELSTSVGFRCIKLSPAQIGSQTDWSDVRACSSNYSMATKTNGTLWVWGVNNDSRALLGSPTFKYSPTQVGARSDWDTLMINSWSTTRSAAIITP